MNRTTNFLIESWLDSAHIAAHDQRRCKTLRYFASTGFCPIRALYTYIRLSLGREPCPYTQMFRSASIVTRTFVIRYLASYTSFLRSFFSLPFILSNNYPINENKDGCSTSLDRSRSQLHHFASLPCSFFFVRVCVCFFFRLHLARERGSFLPAAIQHPPCHTIFSSSSRSDRNRQACNYIVIYAHLRMHEYIESLASGLFTIFPFLPRPPPPPPPPPLPLLRSLGRHIFFLFLFHHICATSYSSTIERTTD